MTNRLRFSLSVAALAAAALIASGCAAGSEPAPAPSTVPPTTDSTEAPDELDARAAWLDEGRLMAVVTWGSSSCIPVAEESTADGQTISVELVDLDAGPCTADFAPRASGVGVPEGVDPTKDVTLEITYGEGTTRLTLAGQPELTGTPGAGTEYEPSAGWFDEAGIVLLTWGSSTCPPIVEGIEGSETGAIVTVSVNEGPCTMDMAPRLTMLGLDDTPDQSGFELTIMGAPGLDGVTVPVIAG